MPSETDSNKLQVIIVRNVRTVDLHIQKEKTVQRRTKSAIVATSGTTSPRCFVRDEKCVPYKLNPWIILTIQMKTQLSLLIVLILASLVVIMIKLLLF